MCAPSRVSGGVDGCVLMVMKSDPPPPPLTPPAGRRAKRAACDWCWAPTQRAFTDATEEWDMLFCPSWVDTEKREDPLSSYPSSKGPKGRGSGASEDQHSRFGSLMCWSILLSHSQFFFLSEAPSTMRHCEMSSRQPPNTPDRTDAARGPPLRENQFRTKWLIWKLSLYITNKVRLYAPLKTSQISHAVAETVLVLTRRRL